MENGFACPGCSERIETTMAALLSLQPLTCPHCGLVLTIDTERSAAALDALQDLRTGLDKGKAERP